MNVTDLVIRIIWAGLLPIDGSATRTNKGLISPEMGRFRFMNNAARHALTSSFSLMRYYCRVA